MIDGFDTIHDYVGVAGALIYIGSYTGLQLGRISGVGYLYPSLSLTAACCVLFGLSSNFNIAAAVIQLSFIAISLVGIARIYRLTRSTPISAEDKAFLAAKLPSLSSASARKLLRLGHWVQGAPGTVLTRENETVEELIYLQEGEASVRLGEHVIGYCGANTFVGELTCLNAEPATATVELTKPSRYLCIGAEQIRRLVKKEPEILIALNGSFTGDLRDKLLTANHRQIVAEQAETMIRFGQADQADQAEKSSPSCR